MDEHSRSIELNEDSHEHKFIFIGNMRISPAIL